MHRLALAVLLVLTAGAGCSLPDGPADGGTPTATPASTGGTGAPTPPPGEGVTVTVARVVDGDTVSVEYENGTFDTVRLIGVDTPEVHVENDPTKFAGVPDTQAGRDCLRDWGEAASSFAKDRLHGATVTLRFDPNTDRRDRYDRLLAYVVVGGESFNYRLVADGYARVYESDFVNRERYYEAEAAAQRQRLRLWGCAEGGPVGTPSPTATATPVPDGGRPVVVAEVHPDAAGDDRENLNDEYVVFESRAEESLDLSGWTVTDEAGATYTFPDGTTLDPGARITLRTGPGTDREDTLYWGQNRPVWNNGGDTVTLRDADGNVVAERSY